MTRAPWRTQDIPDAILRRSTRPSLPAVTAAMGLDLMGDGVDVSSLGIRCDEVYWMVVENDHTLPQLLIWCMDLGTPWQQ